MKNTSEGIATVAMGLDWKPGDRMVAFLEEFPANYLPLEAVGTQGVTVTWLRVEDPLDRIADACRGARCSPSALCSSYAATAPHSSDW